MHIMRRRGWEIPERLVTPEHLVVRRRTALAGAAAAIIAPAFSSAAWAENEAPPRNPTYTVDRPLTAEGIATTYNNYYEFSESKNLWRDAQALPQRPWSITIAGMVAKPRTIDIDDLLKQVQLEERVYRHRCVEAWAMTVPWTGFPLSALVKLADPQASAKYVVFETIQDKTMPGLDAPFYPWPYIEGLTMAEATNDLAFLVTGLYGKPVPPQNGGPIRLVTPWKYGFKSAKAIVKITFTDNRPHTFWEAIQPSEYGFWANVNPAVAHPRWSQASERLIGTDERVPTKLFNGYAEFVGGLYADIKGEKLFM
ncbi:MAG TPA: protein-methionine-sulfoxide reductase catalytic subunit MsrP [Acetobacteraceae bacterium]|jgi:sulfoxide reductase catalytic subunit YedY|nr:protein-methionine-sulfoxide reductase catalytic subunit MsrP [Acetobacteraceae bacterium]